MDNDYYNEEDAATRRLLEAVCLGVNVPTNEEEQEVADYQHN
tara:strand:- start:127 stop:252 length:126 start_codon:yes stop_codon:yes gene_type:complete